LLEIMLIVKLDMYCNATRNN